MSGGDKAEVARNFLELSATGKDFDAWGLMLAEDATRLTPFVPHGLPKITKGRDECVRALSEIFKSITKFRWIDLDLHNTDEPDVVYGTSKSHLELVDGRHYENEYVFIVKFENGLIKEFWEYMSPLPIMECFAKELAGGAWNN
jgi:ketosteroid isomerase-like protein